MSDTTRFLSERLGVLRAAKAGHENEIKHQARALEQVKRELAQAEAAYAAVEALEARSEPEHEWHRPDDLCATIPCPLYGQPKGDGA